MGSLAKEKRNDMIDAFNSASRYLNDLLNIDNKHNHLSSQSYQTIDVKPI